METKSITIYAVKELEIIKSDLWKFKEKYDDYLIYNSQNEMLEDINESKYKYRIHKNSCFWTLEEAEKKLGLKIKRKMATLRKTFEAKMADLQNKYQNLKTLN